MQQAHTGCSRGTEQSRFGDEQRSSSAWALEATMQQEAVVLGLHLDQDRLCSATDKEQAAAGQAG